MSTKIEEIDSTFSEIWSCKKNLVCGDLFLNPGLANDIFFNKLTNITCLDDSMISEAVLEFKKINSQVFVYSLNYPDLENFLIKRNFIYHDSQHVLKKDTASQVKSEPEKISQVNSKVWAMVFCKAYDCMDWLDTVDSIVKNSISQIEYYVDSTHSACVALIKRNSILGLYCLGTVPSKRNQGLASSLIDFALWKVKYENLDFLVLETYEKDGLLDFYKKLGFEDLYQKKIYTI